MNGSADGVGMTACIRREITAQSAHAPHLSPPRNGCSRRQRKTSGTILPLCVGASNPTLLQRAEIGRASCRERVCTSVKISVFAVSLKKKMSQVQPSTQNYN